MADKNKSQQGSKTATAPAAKPATGVASAATQKKTEQPTQMNKPDANKGSGKKVVHILKLFKRHSLCLGI